MEIMESWKEKLILQGAIEKNSQQSSIGNFYYAKLEDIPKDFYNLADEIHYEITPNLAVFVKHVGKFGMADSFVDYLNKRQNCQYRIKNISRLFPIPCWSVQTPCVLSNGEIVACCVDIEGTLSFGNIEHTTLEEAVKSKKRNLIMKFPWLFKTCRKCKGVLVFKKIKN